MTFARLIPRPGGGQILCYIREADEGLEMTTVVSGFPEETGIDTFSFTGFSEDEDEARDAARAAFDSMDEEELLSLGAKVYDRAIALFEEIGPITAESEDTVSEDE